MGQDAGTPPGLWERVRQIAAEEVARFMRSGFLRNASITNGGLSIRNGFLKLLFPDGGGESVYMGNLVNEDTGAYLGTGLLVQDQQGRDIALFRTDEATGESIATLRSRGFTAVSTDLAGGLSRPYVGGGFAPARFKDWAVSTTSTDWETLFEQRVWKQHPRLEVSIRASTDTAGTTGQTRVLVDDVQLGAVSEESFSTSYRYFGPDLVAGEHATTMTVEIQGRVTGGSGALRVEPRHWVGRGSTI